MAYPTEFSDFEKSSRSAPNWLDLIPRVSANALLVLVDGGGSVSRGIVARCDGEILSFELGGPTNARVIGDDQAVANLADLISRCIQKAGAAPAGIAACLVTSAGVATLSPAEFISSSIRKRLFQACTDTATVPDTLGCWAVTADLRAGVAVVSGTGSAVLAGDLQSNMCRSFGNWDFLLGDQGSGFAIGRSALQEAMRYAEGRSSARDIARICADQFGITSLQEIPDAVHKPRIDKRAIAAIAHPVLEQAARGGPEAMRIVRNEARKLAATAAFALTQMAAMDPAIGCFGGIFESATFLAAFREAMGTELSQAALPVAKGGQVLAGIFRLLAASSPTGPWSGSYHKATKRFDVSLPRLLPMRMP